MKTVLLLINSDTGNIEIFQNMAALCRYGLDNKEINLPVHQLKREKPLLNVPIIKKKVWTIVLRNLIN